MEPNAEHKHTKRRVIATASLLQRNILLQVECSLGEVGGAAEVPPIVLVGAEGEDFLALGGEAGVGGGDGEDAFFGEHGGEAGGGDVDAGGRQGKGRGTSGEGRWGCGTGCE